MKDTKLETKYHSFDVAATTQPRPKVIEYAKEIMENFWANPNSLYSRGDDARRIIENARRIIAKKINADPSEIIFCPSASAANTLAIAGYVRKHGVNYAVSSIEHDSIYDIDIEGHKKEIISVNEYGIVSPYDVYDVAKKEDVGLISIGAANSEIGVVQEIKHFAFIAHEYGCVFHTDLTQYIPYLDVNVKALDVDMATFSAHKIGGLRGCAVLYVKNGITLSPLVFGHQEKGLVGGTENTIAIGAMGKAMELLDQDKCYDKTKELLVYLWDKIDTLGYRYTVNGSIGNRLPNNLNIWFYGINMSSQEIVSMCDVCGFEISAGSACNSHSTEPSRVIKALGFSDIRAEQSFRITLNENNTYEEIDEFVSWLKNIIEMNKAA